VIACGTIAELQFEVPREGAIIWTVEYWIDGGDQRVLRGFNTSRDATRFIAKLAANQARMYLREQVKWSTPVEPEETT
jgi:hypothetical protein